MMEFYVTETNDGRTVHTIYVTFKVNRKWIQVYWYDCMGKPCINYCNADGKHFMIGTDPRYRTYTSEWKLIRPGPIAGKRVQRVVSIPKFAAYVISVLRKNDGFYRRHFTILDEFE